MSLSIISFLAACLLPISAPELPAEEGAPPKEAAAVPSEPQEVTLDWDGVTLSLTETRKRFGRFQRNALWDRMERLARKSVEAPLPEFQRLGHWYLARVRAREAGLAPGREEREALKKQSLEHLLKARDLGFRNPNEIKAAGELSLLDDQAEFVQFVRELEAEVERRIQSDFQARLDRTFGSLREAGLVWRPELSSLEGGPFWKDGLPSLVIISRIHHDGFDKLWPLVAKTASELQGSLAVGVVFWQLEREARREQTLGYRERHGIAGSCAVIGRREYKELVSLLEAQHARLLEGNPPKAGESRVFNVYEPVTLFLDAEGRLLYRMNGLPPEWQLRDAATKLAAATPPATAPAPPSEPKPETSSPGSLPPLPGAEKPEKPAAEEKAPPPEEPPPEEPQNGTRDF
jgi:hypothetical protein